MPQIGREAAEPLDQRALYDKETGIESLAEKYHYFKVEPSSGKHTKYVVGENIKALKKQSASAFGSKLVKIKKLIDLCKKMDTEQTEILATLYACWNDLLLDKKACNDEIIIQEFSQSWHHKKGRFSRKRLLNALEWMRNNKLEPAGDNKRTHTKTKKKFGNDLF